MYCPNCGRENKASDLFCSECGKSLQDNNQNSISIEESNKPKKKKGVLLGIIVAVVVLFIVIMGLGTDDMEYSNNSGEELPIVVNQISYQEGSRDGCIDMAYEIENRTKTDYKDVRMAVLAWNSEGYPIKLGGVYAIDFDYVCYIGLENISPNKVNTYSSTFKSADDIAYMSMFLASYEDFDGNEWKNPIIEEVEEKQGQKLEKTELYYFTFQ